MRCSFNAFVLSVFLSFLHARAQAPPAPAFPAAMKTFKIASHGSLLNAFMYVAAQPGPHPVAVLLHGFPGNEKNLDLAQDMRRAGWDVLFFNYRGSWGSPGDFSFTHCIEDAQAAVAYVREPANASMLRADPARIVLLGHSMGGFVAVQVAAADPSILALGTISAADFGGNVPAPVSPPRQPAVLAAISAAYAHEDMAPLAGTSADALARETLAHASQWRFLAHADALASRPVLIVTSDDGLAPPNQALADALRARHDANVITLHLATDHVYSSERVALSAAVLGWLRSISAHRN